MSTTLVQAARRPINWPNREPGGEWLVERALAGFSDAISLVWKRNDTPIYRAGNVDVTIRFGGPN
jgi:hypothetical protein